MIRTNLATRPFYNERAVQLVLLGAGIVVLAATLYNVTRIVGLSSQDTRLARQATSDEARARDVRGQIAPRLHWHQGVTDSMENQRRHANRGQD